MSLFHGYSVCIGILFVFTSWTHVRWLDPNSTYMRVVAVSILVIMWQVVKFLTL